MQKQNDCRKKPQEAAAVNFKWEVRGGLVRYIYNSKAYECLDVIQDAYQNYLAQLVVDG